MKRIISIICVFLVCFIQCGFTSKYSKTNLQIINENDYPFHKLYAHRGRHHYKNDYPIENTKLAFTKAGEVGMKYVETDICETRDGRFYCLHDDRIEYYSNEYEGAIKETPSYALDLIPIDRLNGIPIHTEVKDNTMLKIEDFLLTCKTYDIIPLLEIINLKNRDTSVEKLIETIEMYTKKYIIISTDASVLKVAKKLRPTEIPVMWVIGMTIPLDKDLIDKMAKENIGLACAKRPEAYSLAKYAYNIGYPLMTWVVNDDEGDNIKAFARNPYVWSMGTDVLVDEMMDDYK